MDSNQIEKYAKLIHPIRGSKKELNSLVYYKGSGYRQINTLLRGISYHIDLFEFTKYLGEKQENFEYLLRKYYNEIVSYIYALDRLFGKNMTLQKKLVVYRGIRNNEEVLQELKYLEMHKTLVEKAFISTSVSSAFAFRWGSHETYDPNTTVLLELELPAGIPYIILPWNPDEPEKEIIGRSEMEIILPRECTFHLIEKKLKSYSFKIRFENILTHKKYKIVTYRCRIEYTKDTYKLPNIQDFTQTLRFHLSQDSDLSKIHLSP